MKTNRLIYLCQQLDRKEMTRLKDLAFSAYFNKHEKVRTLLAHLSEIYPDFSTQKLDRKILAKLLWPKEALDHAKLKHVFSYATKLAEQFLSLEHMLRDDEEVKLNLLSALREKQLNKRYEFNMQRLESDISKKPFRNSEFHFQMLGLKTEADKYFLNQQEYRRDESLQERVDYLNLFFLSEKLKNACEMINREKFFKMNYEHRFLTEVIQHVQENYEHYRHHPSIVFYFQVYLTLSSPENQQHYFDLRKMINSQGMQFPPEERKDLYFYAYNYCLRKVNQGDRSFLTEAFELMKNLLEQGLLLENNRLSEWHYKNMCSLGLRLSENKWTLNFIETYKAHLPEKVAANAYNFNLASYYFQTGQLDRALALLNEVEYTDIVYNLDAKSLLLRIYYELDESESLYSLIDAFKRYLTRNKIISEGKYARYFNLFKFANNVFKLKSAVGYTKNSRMTQDLAAVKTLVEESERTANKEWLIKKISDLEQICI